MAIKKNKNAGRIILFVLLVSFLAVFLFANKTWWHLMSLYKDMEGLEGQTRQLEAENKELEKEIARLKTDNNYVEKIARDELGFIKPGEKEYNFIGTREKNRAK
jgi:cell division protein FtsB